MTVEVMERFAAKFIITDTGCWEWQASKNYENYGRFWNEGRMNFAHRQGYILIKGPVPEGLTLDHLCFNPPCVNPAHLEAVTMAENTYRGRSPSALNRLKTHCPKGHPYSSSNTYYSPKSGRTCRTCSLAYSRQYYQKKKLEREDRE